MQSFLNVLLTGASGTVGIEVIKQLVKKEEIKLTVFDKKTSRAIKLFSPYTNQMNVIYGDLCNNADIQRIPDNIDVAIHLAAIIPPLADEKPDLTYRVNVLGTKKIIDFLEDKCPNAFLFYSSSISIYGDRVSNPEITINDPVNPSEGDFYGHTKIEAEELIRNSKLDWSIFRLAAIMKNHKISKLMFHMPLSTILEICTPKDTAKAFVEAISRRNVLSKRLFNLGGGEKCRISYEKFLEKSFHLFGLGKLNFPPNTFAQRNFHCGILEDGSILEEILHFRNDTLETYFEQQKESILLINRILAFTFRILIKKFLLIQSEPYNSIRNHNKSLMQRFFGKTDLSFGRISVRNKAKYYEPAI
jgi:nucleoside-diphosphate-sugar epimerase